MTEPIVSLFGFLEEGPANEYLEKLCVLENAALESRLEHWRAAKAKLGSAVEGAGQPDIREIPESGLQHLQGVLTNPRFADTPDGMPWAFKLVEIDPLIAFQQHVMTARSANVAQGVSSPPTSVELLERCLPHVVENIQYEFGYGPQRFGIRSRNSNLRVIRWGPQLHYDGGPQLALGGVAFGASSPLTQVVRFAGRCYLRNGYHRACALRRAGATHIPCLLLEAPSWEKVGVAAGGFTQQLLESANPPTCGHFTKGRAYDLIMRDLYRVINVTWEEGWATGP